MRLEHYSVSLLKKDILRVIGAHLNLRDYKVFFFGSRVKGGGDERSDVDVGIEGSERVPSEAMTSIREDIENLPTLYKIEVVDFKRAPKIFYGVAKEHIEEINEYAKI